MYGERMADFRIAAFTITILMLFTSVALANTPDPQTEDVPMPGYSREFYGQAPGTSEQIAEETKVLHLQDAPYVQLSNEIQWSIYLPVPRYSQRDSRWSGNNMETCDLTIGGSGCLLTSASMVFRYYGSSKHPGQVNTCMGNSACPWVFADGAGCSDNRATWYGLFSNNYSTFIWSLSEGYPPILELVGGGSTHWVVIYAVSGSGLQDSDYYIIDPWDGYAKSLTAYTGNGWSKGRVAIYGPRP